MESNICVSGCAGNKGLIPAPPHNHANPAASRGNVIEEEEGEEGKFRAAFLQLLLFVWTFQINEEKKKYSMY